MKFKIIIFESLFIIFLPTIDDSSRISFENDVFVSLDQFKKDEEEKKKLRKTLLHLGRLRIVILSWNREKFNYNDQAESFIRVQLQISRRKDGKEK